MPVRRIFYVIGSLAVIGIVGAVVVRQSAGDLDSSAGLARSASTGRQGGLLVQTADAAPADDVFSTGRPTQPVLQIAPAVTLPGGPPAGAQPGVPVTTPGIPIGTGTAPAAPAPAAPATAVQDNPAPTIAPSASGPDETALRYFARQGDSRRLNTEIARLRALYPNWYPPTDMTAPVAITDALLDNMWKLYSQGQYGAARAAIADRVDHEPGWQPPADLLARLNVGESRERLINASGAKQWETVVQIAAANPSLLTCADVDVLWRLAEAFAKSDRGERARDANVYVLTNCQDPKERLATVQKAMAYLSDSELDELLALERTGPDGRGEFAAVRGDIARRRVGAAAKNPDVMASPDDIALLGQLARDGNKADDAVLLGSYLFSHKDSEGAATWFALAKTRADTPEIARGLAYALNDLKRPADAEAAAYRWRDAGPENKQAYLVVATALLAIDPPAKIDPDVMKRMAAAISGWKYPQGAEELGWYAYNTGQTLSAARWFTASLTWKPDSEASAFGLALAMQKLGNKAAFAQIIRVWGPRSQRIADLADPTKQRLNARRPADQFLLPPSIANPGEVPLTGRASDAGTTAPIRVIETGYAVPTPDGTYVPADAAVVTPVEPVAPVRATRVAAVRGSSGGGGGGGGGNGSCNSGVSTAQLRGMSALNRGWCLMGLNRPIEAADAFDVALNSTSGKSRQDAAYGKTLANLRSGLTDAAAVSAASAPQTGKRGVELSTAILTQRAIAAYADNRWVETLLYLDQRSQIAPEQNDLLMLRGWSYYHLGRPQEAKRIFVAVAGTGSRDAARALATLSNNPQGAALTDGRDRR